MSDLSVGPAGLYGKVPAQPDFVRLHGLVLGIEPRQNASR